MKNVVVVSFVIWVGVMPTLFSCSTAFHCRKCYDNAKVKRDTIRIDTTIFTDRVRIDTVVHEVKNTDTVIIHRSNLTIKYKKLIGDTVFISGECAPDTIRFETKVPIVTEVKTGISLWKLILAIIGALLAGGILVKVLGR